VSPRERALLPLAGAVLALLLSGCVSDAASHPPRPRQVPRDQTGEFTTWWADDHMREEGTYELGRRNGHVKGYHPDGSLAFEGDFKDGQPVGELVQNYPGGARAIVSNLKDGLQEGDRLEYFPGGGPRSKTTMVEGHRQGEMLTWHENGELAMRGQFEADLPVGEWQSFDAHGRLTATTVYWTSAGKVSGYLETEQDEHGRITVQTRMLRSGTDLVFRVTMWYPTGRQAGLVEYRNGAREGRDVSWDAEGRKRSEGRRAADLREGVWTQWDETGAVVSHELYMHDKDTGPATTPMPPPQAAPTG
jgi:antitoxin component YwqK of YwqJK toxin-antitoxin module